MDGVINFDKPVGITSAKALYRVRALTGFRKSGHAGTLDPGAEGVLLICCGRATKLVEQLMGLRKVYRATGRLDVTSASLDSDSPHEAVPCARVPVAEEVAAALAGFAGVIDQIPPAISAIKISGRPAYKLARRGEAPELRARAVTIHWLRLHQYEWPMIDFEMSCGRGTYVRALIRDLGARLGVGGCLTSLARTRIGPFARAAGATFDDLEREGGTRLIPIERVVELLADRDAAADSGQRAGKD